MILEFPTGDSVRRIRRPSLELRSRPTRAVGTQFGFLRRTYGGLYAHRAEIGVDGPAPAIGIQRYSLERIACSFPK